MRMLSPDREADLYAITCALGLTKIGVAADARDRRRALQVGSPIQLQLADRYHFARSQDAYAILADVERQLADQREQGSWFRVTPEQVRRAIGNRSARQAPVAASEARQVAIVAQAEADKQQAERTVQQRRSRANRRRQQLRALARLLAQNTTHYDAAREFHVSERTIRRWTKLPGFANQLAKARSRQQPGPTVAKIDKQQRRRQQQPQAPAAAEREGQTRLAAAASPQLVSFQPDATGPIFHSEQQRLDYYWQRSLESESDKLNYNNALRGELTPAESRALQAGRTLFAH
jgi:hypothetical protein